VPVNTTSCVKYHLETSYHRGQLGGHPLDWANQPEVFKAYPGAAPIPLPREVVLPDIRLSSLLKKQDGALSTRVMDLHRLSAILRLTHSLTAKARQGGGSFYFRSAASAGALYPNELYAAVRNIDGLHDGLYHFSIAQHGLVLLRKGDAFLLPENRDVHSHTPGLVFFLSAIFFRSAWKYRARSYRYHLLDAGHLLENLVLALSALGEASRVSLDFDDEAVNRLLGLDEKKEVCLVQCGTAGAQPDDLNAGGPFGELDDAVKNASRVSPTETDYPEIRDIHEAGIRVRKPAKATHKMIVELGPGPSEWVRIDAPETWPEALTYKEAVFTRRSRRNYVKSPISKEALSALLEGLCASADSPFNQTLCIGFVIGRAQGYDPGFYLLDTGSHSYARVTSGAVVTDMARICLDQMWLANAAVHFVFMSHLRMVEDIWGARGYRYAMTCAGRWGERLYLMATAMDLGCCGIGAFYDQEAARLLGLNPDARLLYLVAVGPVKGDASVRIANPSV